MTYRETGVDYDAMDPFKRMCQMEGRRTAGIFLGLRESEFREVEASRGESAYLIETPWGYLAHVEEGLGTKNLVADAMYKLTGKSYYDQIAQDAVACIVNDMITVGAMPISVAMHLGVGTSDWFKDEERSRDLVNGWRNACALARCVWGGGETPTLRDIIVPETIVLSGSSIGMVKSKNRLIMGEKIQEGDLIVFVESSGIHANGLTMARRIGDRQDSFWRKFGNFFMPDRLPLKALPEGYLTRLSDGRTYGETLLDPTHIYVGIIDDCLNQGIDLHYMVNITGHGSRKLMRARQPFTFVIETLPTERPIFALLQKHGPIDDREAYGNLNMGAGFAIYVAEKDAQETIEVIRYSDPNLRAFVAGHIEEGEKKVVIKPKGLEYKAETLAVR